MPKVNAQSLTTLTANVKTTFNKAMSEAKPLYPQLSTKASSNGALNVYAALGAFPSLREWVGERVVQSLSGAEFAIENRKFESTVSITRTAIEDDNISLFASVVSDMGDAAASHPDELLFELINNGFTGKCYDGKPFFSDSHPVVDKNNKPAKASNMLAPSGSETPGGLWLLIDNSRSVNPFIWQERLPYEIDTVNSTDNRDTFMRDEYFYGIRGRGNMGYGLWQLAFASKAPLTYDNFQTLYDGMCSQKNDKGRPLRISPKLLIVGQSNREQAFMIAKSAIKEDRSPNPNYNLVEVIVTPYLD